MKIRNATPEDLDILLKLYDNARSFMAAHDNPTQWGNTNPSRGLLESDIESGCSYVCEEYQNVIAAFYYRFKEEDSYRRIYNGPWLDESPYGVVHRITSSGTIRGTGSFCLDWALSQCGNLRIDTHRDNRVMQHLLEKKQFTRCGIIYLADSGERIAYQKKIV
ncbi:MAG: GNAT family N-acetyltransferase [Ruminococcus sp.]|nr:GNAT family N-acetyltransferase [Ruminococcus sp.]